MNHSSKNDDMETFSGIQIDRQLTTQGWSCLTLDVADEIVKLAGVKGLELYYRTAQEVEAWSTGRHSLSSEEKQAFDLYWDEYVVASIDKGNEVARRAVDILAEIPGTEMLEIIPAFIGYPLPGLPPGIEPPTTVPPMY